MTHNNIMIEMYDNNANSKAIFHKKPFIRYIDSYRDPKYLSLLMLFYCIPGTHLTTGFYRDIDVSDIIIVEEKVSSRH